MGWAGKYAKDLRARAKGGGNGSQQKAPEEEEASRAEAAKQLDGAQKTAIEFSLGLATEQQARCLKLSLQLNDIVNGKAVIPHNFSMLQQVAHNQVVIMQTLATMLDLQIFHITGTTNMRPVMRCTGPAKVG